jgi:hypothetical protein
MNGCDFGTLAFLFLMYTNAPVVAVQFHGLPRVLAMTAPLLLLPALVRELVVRRQPLVVPPALPWLCLYFLLQVPAALGAMRPDQALHSLSDAVIEWLVIYLPVTQVIRTPTQLRRSVWAVVLAGLVLGGLSIVQQANGRSDCQYGGFAQWSDASFRTDDETADGPSEQHRLAGPVGEENRYAQIMLMLCPLALYRCWGERSVWGRAVAGLAAGCVVAGMALTFSRGAVVGLVLVLLVMGCLGQISRRQAAGLLLGLVVLVLALPPLRTRLATMRVVADVASVDDLNSRVRDGAVRGRLTEMLAAACMFADHPILGVGPGMYAEHYRSYSEIVGICVRATRRQAHSLYLGLAAETGLAGLAAFLGAVAVTVCGLTLSRHVAVGRRTGSAARHGIELPTCSATADSIDMASLATGLLLALVAYLATGLFLHLAFARYLWLVMALAGAAWHLCDVGPSGRPAGGSLSRGPAL